MKFRRQSEQGVALIITLILLAVITFMAVTFLVVSRHERERVTTLSSQSDAKFAADTALEKAKADIVAHMLAWTNGYDIRLMVSTNYISPIGYFDQGGGDVTLTNLTNVCYYDQSGKLLAGNNQYQNLNNLLILPRPPVFITTNKLFAPDFRYYLDLNHNGVYDTNGNHPFFLTNNLIATGPDGLPMTNYFFVGDPEWVGILDKPDQRHSSSNQFVARYAFVVVPVGNTLDINYIHNKAKNPTTSVEGFYRNQGFGSWEINLAAFLAYLNTNMWGGGLVGRYSYQPNGVNAGADFQDAFSLLTNRYTSSALIPGQRLMSVNELFGQAGVNAFRSDFIDGYAHGPLWIGSTPPTLDGDQQGGLTGLPWPGSDTPQRFFTMQDLFKANSPNSGMGVFVSRLNYVSSHTNSSYDRYTYYRLLEQLGVDSSPELPPELPGGKLNLNYVNAGGVSATNFIPWTPVQFFTNAANKLLQSQLGIATVADIKVFDGTNFLYSPAIHRVLQLAANIYDASTNRLFAGAQTNGLGYPSVFRPTFRKDGTNVFINGYVEEDGTFETWRVAPLSLPEDFSKVDTNTVNIYGVPWVIGAKKGFPNFNEFTIKSVSQITRKLEIVKHDLDKNHRSDWTTNQMYVVGLSNVLGAEAWNSYSNVYSRGVRIYMTNSMSVALTNNYGLHYPPTPTNWVFSTNLFVNPNTWAGYPNPLAPSPTYRVNRPSFRVPLYTNVISLFDSVYRESTSPPTFEPSLGRTNDVFENTVVFKFPRFVMDLTNRLQFVILDTSSTPNRVIDYVSFNNLNIHRDLTAELTDFGTGTGDVWNTNRVGYVTKPANNSDETIPLIGIANQINISAGAPTVDDTAWVNSQAGALSSTKQGEIDGFKQFYLSQTNLNTALRMQVPFTPTKKIAMTYSWAANDPLVHYTLGDLSSFPRTNSELLITPPNDTDKVTRSNLMLFTIGAVNDRYRPWDYQLASGDTNIYNLALKDPMIRCSDDWDFPTNKFPNIGWLGRVHRGTPWQTVYLKSSIADTNTWQSWSGNPDAFNARFTHPTNDWAILDQFTVAVNDNASRGQLSVNQTNVAAWAAVLQGVVTLTNNLTDAQLKNSYPLLPPQFAPLVIDPRTNNDAFLSMVNDINARRMGLQFNPNGTVAMERPGHVFQHVGDILASPLLTVQSPFLNTNGSWQLQRGLTDAAYERIPQQIMSLLKLGEARYVVYAYGQSLKPADRSIVQSGPYFGMCTNYQITGEVAMKAVVRVEDRPTPGTQPGQVKQPHVVMESFSLLPPD